MMHLDINTTLDNYFSRSDYLPWLNANHKEAISILQLAPNGFLESMSAEKQKAQQSLGL